MRGYLRAFRKYAVFSGRDTRKEFWSFFFPHAVIAIVLMSLDESDPLQNWLYRSGMFNLGYFVQEHFKYIVAAYGLATFLPMLAAFSRRLHDTGRRATNLLAFLLPLLVLILLIYCLEDSKLGENQFGPNPKNA